MPHRDDGYEAAMKLTDEQTAQLAQLAATVPEYWRSGFMQDVQQRLDGYRQP